LFGTIDFHSHFFFPAMEVNGAKQLLKVYGKPLEDLSQFNLQLGN